MISVHDFLTPLKKNGITFLTGVPCSFFKAAIDCTLDDSEFRYVMVPNEGAALAAASGAYLAGRKSLILIQNSGFGNLINPLTSLNMIYKIPVLIMMSGRAYGVPDEPQHKIMGQSMGNILDAIGIKHEDLPQEPAQYVKALERSLRYLKQKKLPFVFFVKKGTLESYKRKTKPVAQFPLKRIEAIQIISKALTPREYVLATTGMPSRELFAICDRKQNFYMQGSMGHAPAIALGLAFEKLDKKIVVLDGDGALLMHMGIMSSIGHYRPSNLYHLVLDNESYETTGNQNTTSSTTNFCQVALAAGYASAEEISHPEKLKIKLKTFFKSKGPAFLRIKINREPFPNIPRISSRHTSEQITSNFTRSLKTSS